MKLSTKAEPYHSARKRTLNRRFSASWQNGCFRPKADIEINVMRIEFSEC